MNSLLLTERIRLYPTKDQERYFNKVCGVSVHVYNKAKEWDSQIKEETGSFASLKDLLTLFKEYRVELLKEIEFPVESHTLRDGVFRYIQARDRSFRKLGGFPRWQSLKYRVRKSFHVREENLKIFFDTNRVKIPGMHRSKALKKGYVRFNPKSARFINPKVKSARVVFDGRYWFLHYVVEADLIPENHYSEPIGVDFGISNLAVTSEGRFISAIWKNDKYTCLLNRKKGLQRKISRQREHDKREGRVTPSNNYFKTLGKLRKVERHLGEFKKSFGLDVAKEITKNNPKIVVLEDLGIEGMRKNKRLSSRIQEVGWYYIRQLIEWEQKKKMAEVKIVDRFYPSSKTCTNCGYVKDSLDLGERTYYCDTCGFSIDRDLNAAINLKNQAYVA